MPNEPRDAGGPAGDTGVPAESVDEALSLLADRRRRYALYHLRDGDGGGIPLGELARGVAAVERDTDPDHVPEDEFERVYLGLRHNHVPRLEDAGVVEYDEDDNRVGFVGIDDCLAECLRVVRRMEAVAPDPGR